MRHEWRISIDRAKSVQIDLAKKVTTKKLPSSISKIAGFDVAYLKNENILIAGMVVLAYPSLSIIASHILKGPISFPYIPGFLSFREAPALLNLIEEYGSDVDVLLFDGHGIAHPRGLGIASHIGVLTEKCSIGCAKKRLIGTFNMPACDKGSTEDLIYKDRKVGMVVRTKNDIKPIFISVGHLAELDSAVRLVLSCCRGYRLPEPTRLAHLTVSKAKQEVN